MKMNEKITREKVEGIAEGIKDIMDEDYVISVNLVRSKIKVESFVMLFQEATLQLLNGNITKMGLQIFVYFLGKLQYSNHLGIDQETIAEDNGISLVYTKKIIKQLLEQDVIISYKDPQDKRRNVYAINPRVAWKGKVKNRNKFINDKQLLLNFNSHNSEL